MKPIIGLVAALVVAFPLAADDTDAAKKELKALMGTWKAVAMEANGTALPKAGLPEFTFVVGEGGQATAKMQGGETKATFTVDPAKTPKTIDNTHQSGPDKGHTQYGIYKLDGDTWTVCMTVPNVKPTERPTKFDTTGTANVAFVFERAK